MGASGAFAAVLGDLTNLPNTVAQAQQAAATALQAKTDAVSARDAVQGVADQLASPNGRLSPERVLATIARNAPTGGPLADIGKAATGKFRIVLGGTSKAAPIESPLHAFAFHLQSIFGTARTTHLSFALDGGSNGPILGWPKQHFAGFGFTRIRGDQSSTARTWNFYGDTATVFFGRETDSAAVNIEIDGTVVGQSPAAGAQAFSLRQTFSGLSATGRHTIKINVPAGAGFVYLERMEFGYTNDTGVEIIDGTKGGSSLWNMTRDWPAESQQVDPVPLAAGNNGIASWRDAAGDLSAYQWTVNDAGSQAALSAQYEPTMNTLIANARADNRRILNVIEVAGHYAMPGDPAYARFNEIVAYTRGLNDGNYSTVADLHAATILDDLNTYGARYFGLTSVNGPAGTYTPSNADFTHESSVAYGPSLARLCAAAGIPRPPSNLALASKRRAPQPRLAPRNLPIVGTTYLPFGDQVVPLQQDNGVANGFGGNIAASATVDTFGPYLATNTDFVPVGIPANGGVATVTMVITGFAVVRVQDAKVRDAYGNELPYDDTTNRRTLITMSSPVPTTFSFSMSSPAGTPALVLEKPAATGSYRVYGLWITQGASPTVHPTTVTIPQPITPSVATTSVVNPGTNSYADATGIGNLSGRYLVTVHAQRADNVGHAAKGTWIVDTDLGGSTQQVVAPVTANSVTGLSLAAPASGSVKATASLTFGSATVNFIYRAVPI